jgi:AcrR family transcriptional regulator
MDAVLDAATELIADRGPKAVTVRAIAQRAGVNHALVHRYFGSKEELIAAVITREVAHFSELAFGVGDPSETFGRMLAALSDRQNYVRFLARAILDGYQAEELRPDFLMLGRILGLMQGDGRTQRVDAAPFELRVAAAALGSLALGWRIFGDFLRTGMALQEVPAAEMDAHIDRFITAAMLGRTADLIPGTGGS